MKHLTDKYDCRHCFDEGCPLCSTEAQNDALLPIVLKGLVNVVLRGVVLLVVLLIAYVVASVAARGAETGRAPQAPQAPQAPPTEEHQTRALYCVCGVNCPCLPETNCGCGGTGGWRWVGTSKDGHVALYRGGTQVGNWRTEEGAYYRLLIHPDNSHTWARDTCPTAPPDASVPRSLRTQSLTIPTQPVPGWYGQPGTIYGNHGTYSGPTHFPGIIRGGRGGDGNCGPGG